MGLSALTSVFKEIAEASVTRIPKAVKKAPLRVPKEVPVKSAEIPTGAPTSQTVKRPVADVVLPTEAEAQKSADEFLTLKFDEFDVDQTHHINFDMIDTGDDIKTVIAQTAESNKGKIEEARRGVVTHDQISMLASEIGVDEQTITTVLTREAGGAIPPMEVVLASRQVLNDSANRLLSLGKKVHEGAATDVEKLQLRRQLAFHSDYLAGFMGLRADVGRTLGVFKIPVGTEKTKINRMKELVETMNGKNLDKIAETLANVDSLSGVNTLAKEYNRSKLRGVLETNFISSILSGLRTQEINFLGNGLFQTMNIAERGMAGVIGRARATTMSALGRPLSPEEQTFAGEAAAQLWGSMTAWRDALKLAWGTAKSGESLDAMAKLELPKRRSISSENLEVGGPLGRVVDLMGSAEDIPFRGLLIGDEFWKTIAHRADLAREAYRSATIKQMTDGLSDHEMAAHIKDIMENPPAEISERAVDYTLYSTFQNPLGPHGIAAQGAVQQIPGLKFLAPFIRTPTNIFKAAWAERSPLGLFSARIRGDIAKGGPQRDLALARIAMGVATVTYIASLADSGKVTGGGPENHAARKVWLLTHKPYSIRIDDPVNGQTTWQSYERAEPLAYIIGATADAVEYLNIRDPDLELDSDAEVAQQYFTAIVGGIADNTMSKLWMSGLSRFSDAMSDSDRYLDPWIKGFALANVPFSGFRRDMSKLSDPMVKEAWTLGEKLRASSGIPGWTKNSPNKLDLFADPISHPKGGAFGVLSAYPKDQKVLNPTKKEVVRLQDETNKVPLSMPPRTINGEKLSSQEYHDLVMLSRKTVEIGGETFEEALDSLMSSSTYEKVTPDSKVTLIKAVQRAYDAQGRYELEQENESFADRMAKRRSFNLRKKYGDSAADRILRDK